MELAPAQRRSSHLRTLSEQARTLDQVRVRVAGTLATAVTASAFLVGIVAKANSDDQDVLYWLGVVVGLSLFGYLCWETVRVLRPKYEWHFTMSPTMIITGWVDHDSPATLATTHRDLAAIQDQNITHNQDNLDLMQQRLSRSLTATIALIACWSILVAKVA